MDIVHICWIFYNDFIVISRKIQVLIIKLNKFGRNVKNVLLMLMLIYNITKIVNYLTIIVKCNATKNIYYIYKYIINIISSSKDVFLNILLYVYKYNTKDHLGICMFDITSKTFLSPS